MAASLFSKIAKSCSGLYKNTVKVHKILLNNCPIQVDKEAFKDVISIKDVKPSHIHGTTYLRNFLRLYYTVGVVDAMFSNRMSTPSMMQESDFYDYVLGKWERYGRKCYRLGSEFSRELQKVNLKVTKEALLNGGERSFFIEFPHTFKDNTDTYHGAFILINTLEAFKKDENRVPLVMDNFREASESLEALHTNNADKVKLLREKIIKDEGRVKDLDRIIAVAPYFKDGIVNMAWRHIRIDTDCLEESLKCGVTSGIPSDMMSYILKVALYLNSGDPDLRELRPDKMTKAERRAFEKEHDCRADIPMTLVSWGWKKPVHYHTGVWSQAGHFRWQPYGKRTENSDGSFSYQFVKLIWIEEQLKQRRANEV